MPTHDEAKLCYNYSYVVNKTWRVFLQLLLSLSSLQFFLAWDTHTHNTQPFYCSSGICPGPSGWAGTRKAKPGRLKQSGFIGARDSEWKWHLLGYIQVYTDWLVPVTSQELTRAAGVAANRLGSCGHVTHLQLFFILIRQHLSCDVCLEVRGEIIRTALFHIVYWSCAQS